MLKINDWLLNFRKFNSLFLIFEAICDRQD